MAHSAPDVSGPGMPWSVIMVFFIGAIVWGINEGKQLKKIADEKMKKALKKLREESSEN